MTWPSHRRGPETFSLGRKPSAIMEIAVRAPAKRKPKLKPLPLNKTELKKAVADAKRRLKEAQVELVRAQKMVDAGEQGVANLEGLLSTLD